MPVYNAEPYVAQAVASIQAQTFADFEFLIVDDGSTDGSGAILEGFAARDSRIRLIRRENRGLVASLNELIERARGRFLARMDADDVALPDRFALQVAHLEADPGCVLVGSRVEVIDAQGRPVTVMGRALTHEAIVEGLLSEGSQLVYHPSVMFRRETLDQVGAYRPECFLCEDTDLFLRMAEVGRLANLAEPLLRYREHLGKLGRKRQREQRAVTRRVVDEARARRGLEPLARVPAAEGSACGPVHSFRCWGWWALMSGHVATARRYAAVSMARAPWSVDSWKLLYCAIRGR
jgi:glycosyltransferase involved in cell wall biosynthesis